MTYQGKQHPWVSIVLSALNKGALADTLKRFPTIALVFMKVMPGTIQRIIKDTKKNEDYAIKLVTKQVPTYRKYERFFDEFEQEDRKKDEP